MYPMYPYRRLAVWEICIVILAFVMMGFQIYHSHGAAPEMATAQIENNLKYDLITILPESSLIESTAFYKANVACVGGSFSTKLEFEDIQKYYDKELISKHWKFSKEKKIFGETCF